MDKEVKAAVDYLVKELETRDDHFEWDEENKTMLFTLPFSEQEYTLNRADFLGLVNECQAFTVDDSNSFIRTARRTLLLVRAMSLKAEFISSYQGRNLNFNFGGGLTMHFHPVSPLVGFVAYKRGAHGDYCPPDSYPCLEILYPAKAEKKTPKEEDELFDSFMFELAATENLVFERDALNFDADTNPFEELEGKVYATSFRPLESCNEGMRLFLAAVRITEPELKLLSLYKVLEYFAPIVTALDSNEALRKKLDSPSALTPDANYLKSIFDLARSVESRKKDKEMIRLVFETCVDFVDISKLLPKPLFRELNHQDKKVEGDHIRLVSDALVATRNQVAHAKSNYQPQGNELSLEFLPEFNTFVEAAAIRTIRWYNRLPAHLKLTL